MYYKELVHTIMGLRSAKVYKLETQIVNGLVHA